MMVDLLGSLGGTWGTERKVVATLVAEHRWTESRALSTVARALSIDSRFGRGKGGTIKFSGSDVAIYGDVVRCIEAYWGPRLGLRNCRARDCHEATGAKLAGKWVYPDVVLLADPKRRDSVSDPLEIHSIEVEQRSGFSIQSVYQSYEQGRGANYSWVHFVADPKPGEEWWDRIVRAATELGVGLVAMSEPRIVGSWVQIRPARRRKQVEPAHRGLLLRATGLTFNELEQRSRGSADRPRRLGSTSLPPAVAEAFADGGLVSRR